MPKPSLIAMARTVVESRPPLKRTTAGSLVVLGAAFTGLLSRESYIARARRRQRAAVAYFQWIACGLVAMTSWDGASVALWAFLLGRPLQGGPLQGGPLQGGPL